MKYSRLQRITTQFTCSICNGIVYDGYCLKDEKGNRIKCCDECADRLSSSSAPYSPPAQPPVPNPPHGLSTTHVFSKTFSIIIPILSFIAGQVAQYILYFLQNRVLLLEVVFEEVNIYVVGLSSILALISMILTCYGAWHFADDDDICKAWTYIIVSSILLSTLPIITGFIGIVATSIITYMVNEDEYDYLPLVPTISAYVLGQAIMWFTYAGTGRIVLVDELLALTDFDINLLVIAIVSSVCGLISTIIMSYVGYYFMDEVEEEKAFGTLIPFCLLVMFTPGVSCFIALIYSFIVFCCKGHSGYGHSGIKFVPIGYMFVSMATMGLLFVPGVPLYIVLIASAVEIGLFSLLFNGKSRLSHYGDDYHAVTIGVFSIGAIAILVFQILSVEELFPNLKALQEMASLNQISDEYYIGAVSETRTSVIIGYIALTVTMFIGIYIGDQGIASITMPLATCGGSTAFLMILNALIKLPTEFTQNYDPTFILWTILGSVLIVLPSVFYQGVTYFLGSHTNDL